MPGWNNWFWAFKFLCKVISEKKGFWGELLQAATAAAEKQTPDKTFCDLKETRKVCNLFQEPVEQHPLGFSIAAEKIRQFKKPNRLKKLGAPLAP